MSIWYGKRSMWSTIWCYIVTCNLWHCATCYDIQCYTNKICNIYNNILWFQSHLEEYRIPHIHTTILLYWLHLHELRYPVAEIQSLIYVASDSMVRENFAKMHLILILFEIFVIRLTKFWFKSIKEFIEFSFISHSLYSHSYKRCKGAFQ